MQKENTIMKNLIKAAIVPVVKIDFVEKAVPLAQALIKGGLSVIEITFRTEAAYDAIKTIRKAALKTLDGKPLLIGAGTIINPEIAKKAIEAGSDFIVSPGTNHRTIEFCQNKSIPIIPGVSSASDIETALFYGLELLKFFPSEALGGLKMIDALRGPFPQISFMPTGGITKDNLINYAKHKSVFSIGGTWMVQSEDIANENWEKITTLSAQALEIWQEGRQNRFENI